MIVVMPLDCLLTSATAQQVRTHQADSLMSIILAVYQAHFHALEYLMGVTAARPKMENGNPLGMNSIKQPRMAGRIWLNESIYAIKYNEARRKSTFRQERSGLSGCHCPKLEFTATTVGSR